ncbi:tyrosine-type recombinase/integrase [Paraburkholderia sp. DGU8]|uniref:tyrosine-type recombinase/integrase n=1 Tax=Paraburkholderia sp. DGU8 TaxID=3161997 RepID=UPI003464ED5C
MKQAKTLTEKELKQVLTYISLHRHAARNRAMLLLTHWAGMRVGEVAALRIGDVVNADGLDQVRNSLVGGADKGASRADRISRAAASQGAGAVRGDAQMSVNRQATFQYAEAGPVTANTMCQHFHWLYKEVGIDGASSHSGRRTFITNLANKGVGVRVLMSLAGHRNISTTQVYIDVNDEMQRAAVDLV